MHRNSPRSGTGWRRIINAIVHFSFVVKRENVSNFYFFFPFSLSLDQRTLFFQISSSMLRPLLEISKSTYPSYVSLYQFSQARADFSTSFQSNNRMNIFIEQRKRYTRIFHFKPESLIHLLERASLSYFPRYPFHSHKVRSKRLIHGYSKIRRLQFLRTKAHTINDDKMIIESVEQSYLFIDSIWRTYFIRKIGKEIASTGRSKQGKRNN